MMPPLVKASAGAHDRELLLADGGSDERVGVVAAAEAQHGVAVGAVVAVGAPALAHGAGPLHRWQRAIGRESAVRGSREQHVGREFAEGAETRFDENEVVGESDERLQLLGRQQVGFVVQNSSGGCLPPERFPGRREGCRRRHGDPLLPQHLRDGLRALRRCIVYRKAPGVGLCSAQHQQHEGDEHGEDAGGNPERPAPGGRAQPRGQYLLFGDSHGAPTSTWLRAPRSERSSSAIAPKVSAVPSPPR